MTPEVFGRTADFRLVEPNGCPRYHGLVNIGPGHSEAPALWIPPGSCAREAVRREVAAKSGGTAGDAHDAFSP